MQQKSGKNKQPVMGLDASNNTKSSKMGNYILESLQLITIILDYA